MPVEAQMRVVGLLPNGDTLYYADPDHFSEPGLKVWNGTEHVAVTLIGSAALEEIARLANPLCFTGVGDSTRLSAISTTVREADRG